MQTNPYLYWTTFEYFHLPVLDMATILIKKVNMKEQAKIFDDNF